MKQRIIITVLFALLFLSKPVFGQVQPPSNAQIQDQLNAAVNQLNQKITELENQITDAKKTRQPANVIDQMQQQLDLLKKQVNAMSGVPSGISRMSDKTIQHASISETSSGVPVRDDNRIKMLPDKTLNDAELNSYLKKITVEVENKMTPTVKANAAELFNEISKKYKTAQQLSDVANTCWINGHPEFALYIMGKVVLKDMDDGNSLNNYASFLSMSGAEQAALPILENLNQKYPDNSTILNNIGQAWYGLGDMNNAKKNLNNCIRFYALHSQANMTMCEIQKSEGNTAEALQSIKRSIEENYTPEKEAILNELGGKLTYENVKFRYPIKAEPMGIEKFLNTIPDYPFEGGETAQTSKDEWSDFREKIGTVVSSLNTRKKELEPNLRSYGKQLVANSEQLKFYNTGVYKTANRKYQLLIEWATDRMVALDKKMKVAKDTIEKWREDLKIGLQNSKSCEASYDLATSFNSRANTLWQQRNSELLSFAKQVFNARANYYLYAATDQLQYEMEVISIKQTLLNHLSNLNCEFEVGCFPSKGLKKANKKNLPDFDSINCKYKSEILVPPFMIITIECNRMKTEFDFDSQFGFKLKGEIEENLATGKYTKGTVEFGYSKSVDKMTYGPLKFESKLELGVGIEFTGSGKSDVYIKGGAKTKFGTNVNTNVKGEEIKVNSSTGQHDPVLETIEESSSEYMKDQSFTTTGMEVKYSWNSGFSAKGSGFLKGVSVK